jgi:hypothetical protein
MEDLGLKKAYLICPVKERFPLARGIEALPVSALPLVL